MANYETGSIPGVEYDSRLIKDACSHVVIKPTTLDQYADHKTIWLNPMDKVKTDGSDLLPVASVQTTQDGRLTSIWVDGSKSGDLYSFRVQVGSVKGIDGSNLNHGSAFSLIDEEGKEVVEKDINFGTCIFEAVPSKPYNLRFKTKEERRVEEKVETSQSTDDEKKSKIRGMLEALKEKSRNAVETVKKHTVA
jgi:hypothetical protein